MTVLLLVLASLATASPPQTPEDALRRITRELNRMPLASQRPTDILEIAPGVDLMPRPALRVVEDLSDRLYLSLTRLVGRLVPGLAHDLEPGGRAERDLAVSFQRIFNEKELHFVERLRDTCPGPAAGEARHQEWRRWAANEQVAVLLDSLKDGLLDRYDAPTLERLTRNYAEGAGRRDPAFLTLGAVIAAASLYANGLHARIPAGPIELGVDLENARALYEAYAGGGRRQNAASVDAELKALSLGLRLEFAVDRDSVSTTAGRIHYRRIY